METPQSTFFLVILANYSRQRVLVAYVCVYVYIYIYTHTFTYIHTHIYIYTHARGREHIRMCVCVGKFACIYLSICTRTRMHTHTCIYMYVFCQQKLLKFSMLYIHFTSTLSVSLFFAKCTRHVSISSPSTSTCVLSSLYLIDSVKKMKNRQIRKEKWNGHYFRIFHRCYKYFYTNRTNWLSRIVNNRQPRW